MLPVVLAALTVVAITMSPQASYAQMVRFGQIERTPSAEVLKLHASNQATMDEALTHPDLPPFVFELPARTDRG
jgi:hypothetical protein